MNESRRWIFDLISTMAVVLGIVYGAIELHNFRIARDREALTELLHIFETPEYNQANSLIRSLPDSASMAQVEAIAGANGYQVRMIANTFEMLGYLVHERKIPLRFIEQTQGSGIRVTWKKLQRYAEEQRVANNRPALWEWYQWLYEQLNRHYPPQQRQPAYILYKDWKP